MSWTHRADSVSWLPRIQALNMWVGPWLVHRAVLAQRIGQSRVEDALACP